MAWSIFTQGGGDAAAKGWAVALLNKIGAPVSPGNLQFVYDWELSEGGGGKFNPLNQGPVPGNPGLTSTGPQFGGGAADFVSWSAGLQGASDYLHMPNFSGILSNLKANNPAAARTALWNSPWAASHYGFGRAWNNSAVPGGKAILPPAIGGPGHGSGVGPGAATPSGGGSGGGGTGTGATQAQLTSFLASPSGVLADAGALLHGTAVVIDRAFGLFAPGQGWRIVFGATAAASGYGSYRAFSHGGDDDQGNLPLAILLMGVAAVALFMMARPWPQTAAGPIKPGAYVVDVLEGQPPPAGPSAFSPTEVHLTEAGLAAMLALWAAGKTGQALGGIAAGAGVVGGILGKVWGWIKGLGGEAAGGAEVPGAGLPPVEVPPVV